MDPECAAREIFCGPGTSSKIAKEIERERERERERGVTVAACWLGHPSDYSSTRVETPDPAARSLDWVGRKNQSLCKAEQTSKKSI